MNSENWSATTGNWNQALEDAFAKKIGRKYAISMNSGTSTLHAALEAAGVGPGDEVISPGLTVIMDSTATIHANAVPVYADINPETYNIDPKDIERKITDKTRAIIPVSLYGLPPDYDPILKIAKKHDLVVIEDNAQCVLSTYKGQMAGTFGQMASYSFENTKHLSCGEGGMLITNDEQYAEAARKIGGHGFKNLKASEGRVRLNQDTFQSPNYKRHDTLGWNYRLSEFNAAIAMAQLERIEDLVQLRIDSAHIFIETMKHCDYLIPQKTPEGYTNSYYTLGVVYNGFESIGVTWEEFRKAYVNAGGDGIYGAWAVPYFEPVIAERKFVARCPWIYKDVHYHSGLCPVAEQVQPHLMQFKTNYRDLNLARKKAEILSQVIEKFSSR
ncbi:DegT/DnrJ/EryC1/StrS aminotransferase family protein [Methanoplanus endosymbiosus]|uniref:DegT/DnrJ/EryC1/StrS family aminotransferase n=1 Tax=Methanoplanus endosymbiosus TaxID=33865 RepID=A0A9E7PQH9_9EURY|nr:DegT/DnrJ/EryC1/StrS family aminotransferase [Methanoplanus endosymbiosus]UUX91657.1 DegT/DnrJ/EryC1/StrS family aminotransferase [Methanoplanus endosymbiosus]